MGDEQAELIGTTLGKKFLVRRQLGSGGMGAVYEVEHVLTKRVGALKLLHTSVAASPGIALRFLREASAAGRIGNPHIVETIDAGELPSGEPYLFMELLEGSSVSELIKRRGRLSFEEAQEIVLQAAEGLGAAHAAGIVHRDVKPENLFLCRGEPPYVKLLDFGISKFESGGEHRLTAEGVPMGTPYYMSPEQVAGKSDVGASSDIYSLGVVLYECVTGSVPYDAGTLPALSIKIFEGKYAPPSSVLGSAPPGLDELIARAMATAPSQRYASMEELRSALSQLGRSSPLSLADTLATIDDLDVTADAARHSLPAARATTDAPPSEPRGFEPDTHAPTTLASPRGRGYFGVALLAGLMLVVIAASWLLYGRSAAMPSAGEPTATGSSAVASAAETSAELPASPIPTQEAAPPSSNSSLPAPGALPLRPAHGGRPRPSASAAPAAPSKAARDGLSEQNPFAE